MNIVISKLDQDVTAAVVKCETVEECQQWVGGKNSDETVLAFIQDEGETATALGMLFDINGEQPGSLRQQFEELLVKVYWAGVVHGKNEVRREQKARIEEQTAAAIAQYDPGQSKGGGRHG